MRRFYYIGLVSVALLLAGCGGGEAGETTTQDAAAEETQTDQTPPPETAAPATTAAPAETTTTSASGGGAYDYGTSNDDTTTTSADDGEEEGEAQADGGLQVADSDLGQILTGPEGMTLYVFLPDEQGESTCYDSCAATWPPLEGEIEAGAGVDETLVGSVERTDGTTQATYNGWPLYHYAGDSAAGDVTGQGVGDNWFVVDPAGEVVDG